MGEGVKSRPRAGYLQLLVEIDAVGHQHDARVGNRTLKAECASKLKIPIEQRKASIESGQHCCSEQPTLYGLAVRIRGLVSF